MIRFLLCKELSLEKKAQEIADNLSLNLINSDSELPKGELTAWLDSNGLAIGLIKKGQLFSSMRCEFGAGKNNHRRLHGENPDSDLSKAIGFSDLKSLKIIDATAGLGCDSFALACLGHEVFMFERNVVISSLLEDGLRRAALDPAIRNIIKRMHLNGSDSLIISEDFFKTADVIYLDPMFPENNKSALVKKEMIWFRKIVGDDPDSDRLLSRAFELNIPRIVVKRMRKAPPLAQRSPNESIYGSKVRFDIYFS